MANTFLVEQLPIDIVGNPGTQINLSSILTAAFGSNWSGYTGFWVAYYGSAFLQSYSPPFSYWNPSSPSLTEWLKSGVPIQAATPSDFAQQFFTSSNASSCALQIGNDIMPAAYLTVAISSAGGTPTQYAQFDINVIPAGLQGTPHGVGGEPTQADIVASAQRFAGAYSGVLNGNDCHNLASDVAAAAGATLDNDATGITNPAQNQSAGFWRVVYRGSDPNPVSNWQTLVQPGDIVRLQWASGSDAGGPHTTTVLSVNPTGSITVFDNADANAAGQEDIGIHTVNYDTKTAATSVTIYRLTTDGLYLINGSDGGEILNGTPQYNNQIVTGAGNDIVNCGPLNDVIDINAASTGAKVVNGGGGHDTVVFSSLSSTSVQITDSNGQALAVSGSEILDPSGQAVHIAWSGGSETLNNVSAVQFSNQTLSIQTANPVFPFTGDPYSQIETVYIAYFGRAGDPGGTNYWGGQLASGALTIQGEAASYSVQAEALAQYPFLASPLTASTTGANNALDVFINAVYQNLFGHGADGTDSTGGLGYWRGNILSALATHNTGTIAQELGNFSLQVAFGATGSDQTALTNKVAVADYFTETVTSAGISSLSSGLTALASSAIASVTSASSSVTAAEASIHSYLTAHPAGGDVALVGLSSASG